MITLEAKIVDQSLFEPIRQINSFLSMISRKLWVELYIKQRPLNEVKTEALKIYQISGRHFNSIRYSLDGKANALRELKQNELDGKKGAVAATKKKIKELEKTIKTKAAALKTIATFILMLAAWRQNRTSKKKPKLPVKYKALDRQRLSMELAKARNTLHQKRRRLAILEARVKALELDDPLSLAFGSKALQAKQHHLKANGYASHNAWLEDWRFARDKQSFWLGSHEEQAHNLNAQYVPENGQLTLRVPYALEEELGKHIEVKELFFTTKADRREGYSQSPSLLAAFKHLELVSKKGKIISMGRPFSYRLIERERGKFYAQVSFEPLLKGKETSLEAGALGLDLNADHIAMTEIDPSGNPIASNSFPFDLPQQTSHQTTAIFGDYIAEICDQALRTGKSLVIENLDFAQKKAGLREKGGSRYAQMLSYFAYSKFKTIVYSRAAKMGVEVKEVNPAYSSIIGFFKYAGCHELSSHEKAALVIARRGKKFSERPKVHGTREGTASILDEHDIPSFVRKRRPRHVWTIYAKLSPALRQKIRTSPKEALCGSYSTPQRPSGFMARLRFQREKCENRGKASYEALQAMLRRFQAESSLASRNPGCWGFALNSIQ